MSRAKKQAVTKEALEKSLEAAINLHAKYQIKYNEVCEQTKKVVATYTAAPTERNKKLSTAAVSLAAVAERELKDLEVKVETKRAALSNFVEQKAEPMKFDDAVKNSTVAKASAMWNVVKEHSEFPAVRKMTDKEKMTYFREKLNFGTLMDELPVVTQYMIRMGQFSAKALAMVIDKSARMVHPPIDKRPRDYTHEQWVCRQADYVQYMYDDYNKKKHYNMAERKQVWERTYKLIKGEFDDFKSLHKETTEKIEEEKLLAAGDLTRDLLQRVSERTQPMQAGDEAELSDMLFKLLYKKNVYNHVMRELLNEYPPILESCSGYGQAEEHVEKQAVRMIETVDTDRMKEIPDHYKPEEYRGMEPVYEEPDEYELVN
jgi:hypothetical protein